MRSLATFAAPVMSPLSWLVAKLARRPGVTLVLGGALAVVSALAFRHDVTIAPWLLLSLGVAVYVADVARAREMVRDVVLLGWAPPKLARCATVRAESLVALAAAFGAARARDAIGAEIALARVQRTELGAWELRVFDAVRALASVEVADDVRAAQLAPLALPTGDLVVDRALALVAVRTAWDDDRRLAALAQGMSRAGHHLVDVGTLCSLRGDELVGRLEVLPPSFSNDVVSRARDVGDDRFADLLASLASRRGVYRLAAHAAISS